MVFEGHRSHGERLRGCGHHMGKGINMNEKGGYVTPLDGSWDTPNEQDKAVEKGKHNALAERLRMGKVRSSPVSAQMCKRRVSSVLLHPGTVLTLRPCGGAFRRPHLLFLCWVPASCRLLAWCCSLAIMLGLSLLPFWPTVPRKHWPKIWAFYFYSMGTKWALCKDRGKCTCGRGSKACSGHLGREVAFKGGSGASSWNYHCKAKGSTGSKEIPTISPTHFPRQGIKELRIRLIFFFFFRLRGEFNPKRYYKRSNEVTTSQRKGEKENGKLKSKNTQEKDSKISAFW